MGRLAPLLIGPAERAELAALRAAAEAHPIPLGVLQLLGAGVIDCPSLLPGWRGDCELPVGYVVGFTIEQHRAPDRLVPAPVARGRVGPATRPGPGRRAPGPLRPAGRGRAARGLAGLAGPVRRHLNVLERIVGPPPHLQI